MGVDITYYNPPITYGDALAIIGHFKKKPEAPM